MNVARSTSESNLRRRIAVARGDQPADLVLTGGRVVNVYSREIQRVNVAIYDGHIVGLGDYRGTAEVNVDGAFLLPGFIESHIHIESSKVLPSAFAEIAAARGTTTVIADPHEIANVLGIEGIKFMLANSRDLPVEFFYMAPSCVPATNMETSGASLSAESLQSLLNEPTILGLGEMMNFPGAVYGDPEVLAKIALFHGRRPIDGHAPGLGAKPLNAYITAGPQSDHECTTYQEALEKLSLGMRIFIREGSTARNLDDLARLVTPAAERRICLVTDDKRPGDLIQQGHLDHLLRRAVSAGLDPVTAVRLVTLNPAETFGLSDRGAIRPGARADIVAVEDLNEFRASRTWSGGKDVSQSYTANDASSSGRLTDAVVMKMPILDASFFAIPASSSRVRAVVVIPDQIITDAAIVEPSVVNGCFVADPSRDIVKVAVIERYTGAAGRGLGFALGLGLKRGAIASTVAHDSHNIIVAGCDDDSMLTAVRHLVTCGGGQCAAVGGRVIADLPLPVAGLMSRLSVAETAEMEEKLIAAARELGGGLSDPFMALSFLALPVIPRLKITDKGLIDVEAFQVVPLTV